MPFLFLWVTESPELSSLFTHKTESFNQTQYSTRCPNISLTKRLSLFARLQQQLESSRYADLLTVFCGSNSFSILTQVPLSTALTLLAFSVPPHGSKTGTLLADKRVRTQNVRAKSARIRECVKPNCSVLKRQKPPYALFLSTNGLEPSDNAREPKDPLSIAQQVGVPCRQPTPL